MRGRTSDTSAISMRPNSSDSSRNRAVTISAASAGLHVVAEHHVGEADGVGRENRDGDRSADRRVQIRSRLDLRGDGVACGVGGNDERRQRDGAEAERDKGADSQSNTFESESPWHECEILKLLRGQPRGADYTGDGSNAANPRPVLCRIRGQSACRQLPVIPAGR